MKKYRLLKDLPTFKAGEIFHRWGEGPLLRPMRNGDPGMEVYDPETLRKFPNILTEWFEEVEEERAPWRAEKDGQYWYVDDCGEVSSCDDFEYESDDFRYRTGNYFRTKAEANRALAKLKAYATIKRDAKGFKPDWDNIAQKKWRIIYNRRVKTFVAIDADVFNDLGQVYFASEEDAEESLRCHPGEWETLFDLNKEMN